MNLVQDPWLLFKVKQPDGRISEQELPITAIAKPEVIDFALPRADFQGAAYQFAIGLLQTLFAPADKYEWEDLYLQAPSEEQLQQAFDRAAHAFNATGDGPLFMQDYESLDDVEPVNIDSLLVDAPGDNTLKHNKDLFVKRNRAKRVSVEMAIWILFTSQINGPCIGTGYRSGIRKSGPLTTLLMPGEDDSALWQKLWLNVLDRNTWIYPEPDLSSFEVFPWLDRTKSDETIYPNMVHPLHVFWAMPQRVRLYISEEQVDVHCELSTRKSRRGVVEVYRRKNKGNNYDGDWLHSLTPRYWVPGKSEVTPRPVLANKLSSTYKIWESISFSSSRFGFKCARVVDRYNRIDFELVNLPRKPFLWVFGYHMEQGQKKVHGWYSSSFPYFKMNTDFSSVICERTDQLLSLADSALTSCVKNVKEAWFKSPLKDKKAKIPKGDFSFVEVSFWQRTQLLFFTTVQHLIESDDTYLTPEQARSWLNALRATAFDLFDELALSELGSERSMAKRIKARKALMKGLHAKPFKDFEAEYRIESNKEIA
ncbi:type I-E CRISPR-associated protein Cse1/CasA [Aliagarivorans taiwanensis]|uniref:type I-E CRISPR-associated protein Cse1/CasA n=1 Tax=Aliagarivorans taiwanensis TaxID=561966 RepID=UPI0004035891|nr:type I-E CRISPR-associated protein Cse1/CasA [Aliagarivorans taiwanensis]